MRGKRTITGIALITTGLLLFQGSVLHACTDPIDIASTSAAPDEHAGAHDAHDTEVPAGAAGHAEHPTCPMAGLMLSCGTVAVSADGGVVAPTAAVSRNQRISPTFIIPQFLTGMDLFHPPRARVSGSH